MKSLIHSLPGIKTWSDWMWKMKTVRQQPLSDRFWKDRYKKKGGGTSGPGSYGRLAEFKARVLNDDFGCGDGNQIRQLNVEHYLGVDVSPEVIDKCRKIYCNDANKSFVTLDAMQNTKAEMALSLDVIFHLVEDIIYDKYMRNLFDSSERFVLIYSSNFESIKINPFTPVSHVRHRKFVEWVERSRPNWKLVRHIENPYFLTRGMTGQNHSRSEFYLYEAEQV
jgi:hypothetical protein